MTVPETGAAVGFDWSPKRYTATVTSYQSPPWTAMKLKENLPPLVKVADSVSMYPQAQLFAVQHPLVAEATVAPKDKMIGGVVGSNCCDPDTLKPLQLG